MMILSIPDSSYLKKVAIEPEINGFFEDCFQMIVSFEERGAKSLFMPNCRRQTYLELRSCPTAPLLNTPDFKVALLPWFWDETGTRRVSGGAEK